MYAEYLMAERAPKLKTKQRRRRASSKGGASRKSMPLATGRDASRTVDVDGLERAIGGDRLLGGLLSANQELAELMSRRTKALLELPLRLSSCTSPIQVWAEQAQFVQDYLGDCYTIALRMVEVTATGGRRTRT
jgi:hypothetical protein